MLVLAFAWPPPDVGAATVQPVACHTTPAHVWNRLIRAERTIDGHSRKLRHRPVCIKTYTPFKRHVVKARHAAQRRWQQSFTPATASWYGPGLYGNRTACGQRLTPGIVGVANKSLPCGTTVWFRYNGRVVAATVIDRGPFIAGRTWDLTAALKASLGFPSLGTVWTTTQHRP